MKSFGSYIMELRIEKSISLSDFCKKTGFDPSSWNKVENGYNKPPKNSLILKLIAEALNVALESELHKKIVHLSTLEFTPKEAMTDSELLNALPAFINTSSGKTPSEGELNEIASIIKKSAAPDFSL